MGNNDDGRVPTEAHAPQQRGAVILGLVPPQRLANSLGMGILCGMRVPSMDEL